MVSLDDDRQDAAAQRCKSQGCATVSSRQTRRRREQQNQRPRSRRKHADMSSPTHRLGSRDGRGDGTPRRRCGGYADSPWGPSPVVLVERLAHLSPSPKHSAYRHGLLGEEAFRPRSEPPKGRRVRDNFVNIVVDKCGRAVVRVNVEQQVNVEGDHFALILGFGGRSPRERKVEGHGSGFCIEGEKGIILTNAHVVQGASKVSVTFSGDGETVALDCEVLEVDEVIDLAALRVMKDFRGRRLPEITLGHSSDVKAGDWAIALGNPLGLTNTCTLGIVSSLDRSTGETGFDWMRQPLIQTDAAVNQGNSGGPLLNELGEVIGMVGMRAMFGEGIGFATPADTIRAALPDLLVRRKVPRAYLGIRMSDDVRAGVCVDAIVPRSPAEKAGLRPGDELLEANGQRLRRFLDVQKIVRRLEVGAKVRLKFRRGDDRCEEVVVAGDVKKLSERNEKSISRGRRGR
eukprot:TRINITY_DN112117_c0_g1_i1.p1 TRINITY_DN112117_c0_g1~~TRINITY_DN112117_c0_g1_i1.p1  ORF type:complete len:459 (-),score=51.98 TRINITY_DN112117_c0_g1_i1:104-1480(-)